VHVGGQADLVPGRLLEADVDGTPVVIVGTEAGPCALQGRCTHAGANLVDGIVRGFEVECPLHGARFDVRTGEVLKGPARQPLQTYETRLVDGAIEVCLGPSA